MKYIQKVAMGIVAMATISCNNFLDITPVGQVIPTTYGDFRALMTKGYENVPTDRSMTSLLSDELQLTSSESSTLAPVYAWTYNQNSMEAKQFPWQLFYKAIFHANHVIDKGPAATEGSQDEINQLIGEAYMLRAYMHFNLVNLYADHYGLQDPNSQVGIPISQTIDPEQEFHKNSVAEVYELITSDIDQAMGYLNVETQPKGYNYRFSLQSANGIAARVYQFMGDHEEAKSYATQALAYGDALKDLNTAGDTAFFHFESVENILALEQTFESSISREALVSPAVLSLFTEGEDLRRAEFFEADEDGGMKVKLGYESKHKVSLRTAELYLIIAESAARANDLQGAQEHLATLLQNRYSAAAFAAKQTELAAFTQEEMLDFIFDERQKELYAQGFRWFDLKRNGKPSFTKANSSGVELTIAENDPRYIVRFPQEAIDSNPNLLD